MLLFSVMFLFVAVILIQVFGSVGFILANCINMATRILHRYMYKTTPTSNYIIICSTRFIKTFFNTSSLYPLTSAFPALVVIVTLVIAFVFTFISQVSNPSIFISLHMTSFTGNILLSFGDYISDHTCAHWVWLFINSGRGYHNS